MADNGVSNPHCVPDSLKDEYQALFGNKTIVFPQPGGQEQFLNCPADICFYGGSAGAGKSWCLSYEHAKWFGMSDYEGALVRKTYRQIFRPGGLWSNAGGVFKLFGGRPTQGAQPVYSFPSGAKVYFLHSQHASKVDDYWQGIEVPYIGIDEVTQFEKDEFLYITSRLRSMTGINAYLRATCNPDPNSWVREMIDWWIDEEGYIISERCGAIRYYVHRGDRFVWADEKQELIDQYGVDSMPMSFTFIRGHLEDNRMLLDKDPSYRAKLQNLTESQKRSLCDGNWNLYDDPLALFKHANFNAYRVPMADFKKARQIVIGVDPCGSTAKGSDDCGIVAGFRSDEGHVYITHDMTGNYLPNDWAEKAIALYDMLEADEILAESNYGGDMVKNTIDMVAKSMGRSDVNVKLTHSSRGKHLRAEPVSALYEKGLIHHVGNGLGLLEKEMAGYREGQDKSPNRLDALVFVITRLLITKGKHMPRLGVIR